MRKDEQSPPKLKLHRTLSMEESSNNELQWKETGNNDVKQSMPSLTFDISTTQIAKHFIQLTIWSSNEKDTATYICEAKFPLWKMFDKQFAEDNLFATRAVN